MFKRSFKTRRKKMVKDRKGILMYICEIKMKDHYRFYYITQVVSRIGCKH